MKLKIAFPQQLLGYLHKLKSLARHHFFFSSLAILGGLVVAVYVVNETLSMPTDDAYKQQKTAEGLGGTFDQATIKKIEALKRSSEQGNSVVAPKPGTRTNPFAE